MDVGLSVYDIAAAELLALGRRGREAGFATLWLGEHVVLPGRLRGRAPDVGDVGRTRRICAGSSIRRRRLLDPLVAPPWPPVTERIGLATGIYLLPLRHPLAVARMTLTLQGLAGGRFMLGVGSGWLAEEFAALGVPFDERGPRFDEALGVLRAAWAGGEL